jgi:uncharacterized protein
MRVKLSRFAHEFRKKDKIALYHSVFLETLYSDLSISPLLTQLKEGIEQEKIKNKDLLQKLFDVGLIVEEGLDEMQLLEIVKQQTTKAQRIGLLYLLPTDDCNFRCKYCFIRKSTNWMNKETCKNAIDYFFEVSHPEGREIILYGGEPLLNWEICKLAVEYTKAKDNRTDVRVVTNGSLVDNEIAAFLARFGAKASVSIDGPEEINDSMRRDLNNRGTFEKALKGYNLLKDNGIDCGISCTISTHNINVLPEITEWICVKLQPTSLGFNIPIVSKESPLHIDSNLLAEKLIKCFEICKTYGIYEDRVGRKVINWVKKEIYPSDCAGIGCQVVITPDGKIGPCHAFIGTGKYFSEKWNIEEDENFKEFTNRYPFNMQECYDCEALGICGGGCPYKAYLNYRSIWKLDEDHCTFAKRLLEHMIWESYEKINL